ncbi:MAG: ferredoxin [Solirubrobacteraceae bacterium]
MRVVVDLNTCQGYANCVVEAPDLFDVDDETGKAVVLLDEFEADVADDAQRAVDNCPVSAITIMD